MGWVSPRGGHALPPPPPPPATGRWPYHGGEAPGVRGPASRKPRGKKEGPGGPDRYSRVAQELRRPGRLGRPRASPPSRADPRRVRTKSERSPAPRGGRRAPPSPRGPPFCDFTGFATNPGRPRPTHPRPAASPPAASLGSPRLPPSEAGPAPPSRSLPSGRRLRASTCATPAPRVPRRAPLGAAPSRRRRDAVLPEGNGLRALSSGDLVVRRLHHLLRGRGALGARQPLPTLHQELAVPLVHDGGALLAFVCGVVYTLLQSVISYKSCPQWNSLSTCHVRMAISAVSCAAVVPTHPPLPQPLQ
ncbi:DNA damage-regulated autophagy modulator protein 1 isoform X2 [Prionailurus viverrinus]|uniref:DNA damage-regulated autophagy modulator protein 1 isoform X2 n=1 Tax=Prionailurus viverrinus TaxID=61388 RepID=UPI001FF27E95|nr:DNA damage-regulated autophagy modulator protein 1 isoform X2 [Prionailurus viverrinus]